MIIKSALNGGLAEVDDEFGKELLEGGQWLPVDAEPKAVRKPRTRKPAVEEPKPEE